MFVSYLNARQLLKEIPKITGMIGQKVTKHRILHTLLMLYNHV